MANGCNRLTLKMRKKRAQKAKKSRIKRKKTKRKGIKNTYGRRGTKEKLSGPRLINSTNTSKSFFLNWRNDFFYAFKKTLNSIVLYWSSCLRVAAKATEYPIHFSR